MRSLSASDMLLIWERGQTQTPLARLLRLREFTLMFTDIVPYESPH